MKQTAIVPASRSELVTLEHFGPVPDWFAEWLNGLTPNTARAYRSGLSEFFTWRLAEGLNLSDITPAVASAYVEHLAGQGMKASTLNARVSACRSFFDRYGENSNLQNPFKAARVKDKIRATVQAMADEQIKKRKAPAVGFDAVRSASAALLAEKTIISTRDGILLLMAFLTGRRRSELAGMKWSHMEQRIDGVTIRVVRSKSNQDGSKEDYCHLFHATDRRFSLPFLLQEWRKVNKSDYLFPSIHKAGKIQNKPLHGRDIARLIKKHLGEQYTGHSTRRGFITEAYQRGESILNISHQTGQTGNTIQLHYADQIDKRENNAAKVFTT